MRFCGRCSVDTFKDDVIFIIICSANTEEVVVREALSDLKEVHSSCEQYARSVSDPPV